MATNQRHSSRVVRGGTQPVQAQGCDGMLRGAGIQDKDREKQRLGSVRGHRDSSTGRGRQRDYGRKWWEVEADGL